MKAFRIENGVPMPPPRTRANLYPFLDMMPSQSFLVPCKPDEQKRLASRLSSAAWSFSLKESKGKFKFVTRRVEGGVRCWRLE